MPSPRIARSLPQPSPRTPDLMYWNALADRALDGEPATAAEALAELGGA
ncbi:MAG TPA: hypothetical protein VIE46_05165 [Gemmatimonadales bacterium]